MGALAPDLDPRSFEIWEEAENALFMDSLERGSPDGLGFAR